MTEQGTPTQDTTQGALAPQKAAQLGYDRRNRPSRPCLICGKRAYAEHAYCPMHQLRYERHGDATVEVPRGRPPKEKAQP